ncbi:hypothetical protein [Aquipluma nitroreducens]|uniref:hypothetical protein n=1 Tax=Aquipluma nitroreducens TaxID=2010828 RepID=UPI00296E65C5|nr:hypothetical protein [Aquipluma nitroreducens]
MCLCGSKTKLLLIALAFTACQSQPKSSKIDRFALVNRHNITIEQPDTLASLSVGNGDFAFTTDVTGLQTFYKEYENGVTLGIQSNWGWHTFPNTENYNVMQSALYSEYRGRKVPYLAQSPKNENDARAIDYFRENPQRLQLGVIRLVLKKADGTEVKLVDIQNPKHQLNLWEGRISSEFSVEGQPVKVEVFCHQKKDMVSAKISSPLIKKGQLKVEWIFPYAVAVNTHSGYDFASPDKHQSKLEKVGENSAKILRTLDNDHYQVKMDWVGQAELAETEKHHFVLSSKSGNLLEFSCLFAPEVTNEPLPAFAETETNNLESWKKFWKTSGAVDFSACTDPRAKELERRFVLSQYLTKIQNSGSIPPQETGLVYNSWYGKAHLEMHWWHSAHFANWGHPEVLDKQLEWYHTIYQKALETAQMQGFKGVRWPKMVGPEGQNSPSGVGSYLIWQQPHIIYMAEQLYRSNPSPEILNKYKDLIFATADFMADFAVPDSTGKVYNLLPPLIPAQEHWKRETTMNPPFELAYWHWALGIAQEWHKRLNQPVDAHYDEVLNGLPAPYQENGVYLGIAKATDSYTNPKAITDHPMVIGTVGMLPMWDKVDAEVMRATLKKVMSNWDWPTTWGWDYPMVAMCATRLNEPEIALEALLKDVQKNTYLKNGHNYQSPRLRIYLPGNGGFLKTIALMCAGWEGCTVENPGFPKDGKWNVKWEGLTKDF